MSQNIVIRESEQEAARDNIFNDLDLPLTEIDMTDTFVSQLFNMEVPSQILVAGVCDSNDLRQCIGSNVQPSDFDIYLLGGANQNPPSSISAAHTFDEQFFSCPTLPTTKIVTTETSVELSRSVGVGRVPSFVRQSHKISLVYELEETYRPRYKSDYFAQNGTTRKPRYVADRNNNHFITLKVPKGVQGCIRIDWLTVRTANGDIYSMPYRFQASNDKIDVPDLNPLYVPIETDADGKMKIYLVLIKAKQDDLKTLQPLQRFEPLKKAFGFAESSSPQKQQILMPKQLIKTYQLEKSQLAFTFCSLSRDGTEWIPEWDTTIYSTEMAEESPDANRIKAVACPKCSHSFPVSITSNDEEETTTKKRKKNPNTVSAKKQRRSNQSET